MNVIKVPTSNKLKKRKKGTEKNLQLHMQPISIGRIQVSQRWEEGELNKDIEFVKAIPILYKSESK